jgi:hypothetical protein
MRQFRANLSEIAHLITLKSSISDSRLLLKTKSKNRKLLSGFLKIDPLSTVMICQIVSHAKPKNKFDLIMKPYLNPQGSQ